jgi:uncharacterized protein YigE (DUF2233 family)
MYWKDDSGKSFRSLGKLATHLKKKKIDLVFAMNGGMYGSNNSPIGLFVREGIVMRPINRLKGYGNFYLQPNGYFFIDNKNIPGIALTREYHRDKNLHFATQSGPMLIIDGKINNIFNKESESKYLRNGIGLKDDNTVVFILSSHKVNLYEFSEYFIKEGCYRALYLDGFVSRALAPYHNHLDFGGDFGVIIGVTEKTQSDNITEETPQ